jgi:prepilin-type N-terminal cleavage/methylation domain-containing protein
MRTLGNSKCADTGFTMIEVALAIAVLALGVLALYALLASALDTSTKAKGDTQAAMFADSVFNTLRAQSAIAAEQEITVPGSWTNFWNSFSNGVTTLPVAFATDWGDGNMAIQNGGPFTESFTNNYGIGERMDIVNHSLRYTIDARLEWADRADVLLRVWDGTFGPTSNKNALVFYSEFRKEGDL